LARTEPYVSAPPSAADLPYQGIGAELRVAREATGQSADMVASTLRIRRPHIQAIEQGRFRDLPGQVYAVGFIRAYAEFLHLDADAVVERFRMEADGPDPKLELHFPEPASRRARLDFRALGVGLLIAGGAYGVWYYLQTDGQLPRELVATVPPNLLVAADRAISMTPSAEPDETAEQVGMATQPFINVTPVDDDTPGSLDQAPTTTMNEPPANGELPTVVAGSPSVPDRAAPNRGMPAIDAARTSNAAAGSPESAQDRSVLSSQPPGTVTVRRLSNDSIEIASNAGSQTATQPAPTQTEEPLGALIAALESEDDTAAVTGSDSELPPMSDSLEGYRLGDTAEDEPGNATAITGALAETPEAPTLLENELPTVPKAPLVNNEPRIYGQGNTDARVVVRARIESWVQIEGANNELLLTRVLRPGDMFLVPNRSDLRLVTGNAGGIEILVDGVLMPPLGPEGTVRRDISLAPDALTGADTVSSR